MDSDFAARGLAVQARALSHFAAEGVAMIAAHIARTDVGGRKLAQDLYALIPGNMGADTDHLRALLKEGAPRDHTAPAPGK